MRTIVKGSEPRSLTAHRQKPSCNYGNYGNKDVLRRALVTEQRETLLLLHGPDTR